MEYSGIFESIRQISSAMESHCRTLGEQGGLTSAQCFCLMYIYENKDTDFCSTDLCEILGTSRASVSLLLKGMKKKGYLRMDAVEGDDRKKQLGLTPKAIDFAEYLRNDRFTLENAAFSGVSADELDIINNRLKTILSNMKK